MRQVRIDIETDAMERDPMAEPDSDRCDLVLTPVFSRNPDSDPSGAPLALGSEVRKRADQPLLEIVDVSPRIRLSLLQVQHHVTDALARPMIGVLAPAEIGRAS